MSKIKVLFEIIVFHQILQNCSQIQFELVKAMMSKIFE